MYWFYFTLFSFVNEIHTFNVSVKVKQGIILGKSLTTVFNEIIYFAFYAVPYAQQPIGILRFKNPKRIKKWRRPYDATLEYHGACAQEHIVHKSTVYGTEDCLYLNIYTPQIPQAGKSKPVLKSVIVWIHGYAFTTSLSHVHGPDFLIENDVIVVTLSHRLGAFGFAKINQTDSHANMGLKDIVLGLQWLHKNIESFGGDKNKITVAGSGSASSYISLLLVTKYKKLFSKIILQSGSVYSPSMFQGNETYEKLKLDTELRKQGYKNILEASTKDIIEASRKIYSRIDTINIQRPVIPFLPSKELESRQSLLTLSPAEIYADIENKNINKPILLGYASQEGISEMIPFIHNPHHLNLFTVLFKYMVPFVNGCRYEHTSKTYNIIANKIKHNYIKNGILENAVLDFLKLSSDLQKYSIFKFIKSQLRDINNKLYVYNFNYIGKLNVVKATSMANAKAVIKGAAQGDEICYLFNCEPQGEIYFQLKFTPDNVDTIFIKEISQMWANFAKYSDPNLDKKDSVKWLPMTANRDYVFRFGKTNKLTNSKNEQKMIKFWDEIYDQFYSDKNCNRLRDEL